jgi:uncharacterized membrane protein YfbV (UPF0208 family)
MKITNFQILIFTMLIAIFGIGVQQMINNIIGIICIIIGGGGCIFMFSYIWFSGRKRYRTSEEEYIYGYDLSVQMSELEEELTRISALPSRNIMEELIKKRMIKKIKSKLLKIKKK